MGQQYLVDIDYRTEAIAARSEMYAIFSRVFRFPTGDADKQFILIDAAEELRKTAPALPYSLQAAERLAPACPGDLGREYTSLFDNCGSRAKVSLHEKDYVSGDPKRLWEDIIRFYEFFGLNYDLGACREWPDWVGLELEFLHYLTFLEAGVDTSRGAAYIAAEADFLERHAGAWMPTFCNKVNAAIGRSPYRDYADVLAQFIVAELAYTREQKAAAYGALGCSG